jgi:hypothetical protein
MEEIMDVLHIKQKGQLLNTWTFSYVPFEQADKHIPIFDLIIKNIHDITMHIQKKLSHTTQLPPPSSGTSRDPAAYPLRHKHKPVHT